MSDRYRDAHAQPPSAVPIVPVDPPRMDCVEFPKGSGYVAFYRTRQEDGSEPPLGEWEKMLAEIKALRADAERLEARLSHQSEWHTTRLMRLMAWFRNEGRSLPIADQFWNIVANNAAHPCEGAKSSELRMLELTERLVDVERAAKYNADVADQLNARATTAEKERDALAIAVDRLTSLRAVIARRYAASSDPVAAEVQGADHAGAKGPSGSTALGSVLTDESVEQVARAIYDASPCMDMLAWERSDGTRDMFRALARAAIGAMG